MISDGGGFNDNIGGGTKVGFKVVSVVVLLLLMVLAPVVFVE
jgi:hypothetical protein